MYIINYVYIYIYRSLVVLVVLAKLFLFLKQAHPDILRSTLVEVTRSTPLMTLDALVTSMSTACWTISKRKGIHQESE